MAEKTRRLLDPAMASALAYPLRVYILAAIAERPLSPAVVAKECEVPVSKVAYHFRVLRDCGCIALDSTVPRRGAVEHIYRATDKAPFAGLTFAVSEIPKRGGRG